MNMPLGRSLQTSGETTAFPLPDAGEAQRILVVDADETSRAQSITWFREQGWDAEGAASAAAMDMLLAAGDYSLLVLDQIVPGESGLSICRRLSRTRPRLGIVFLSQYADETDRIVALELGADDYIVKPCNPRELVARLRAFLRRRAIDASARDAKPAPERAEADANGPWTLNPTCNSITSPSGAEIRLAGAEIALLNVMVGEPKTLLSRDDLLVRSRGCAEVNYPRIVDITISRLRRKISRVEPGRELVRTIRGRGYVLTAEVVVEGAAGAEFHQPVRAETAEAS